MYNDQQSSKSSDVTDLIRIWKRDIQKAGLMQEIKKREYFIPRNQREREERKARLRMQKRKSNKY